MNWHILTGEYPPQSGGLSDYTRLLAHALASGGDSVDVWAPRFPGRIDENGAVRVHSLPDCFGPRSLERLDRGLRAAPRPFRLLVQYVPYMYGFRSLNLLFCLWVRQFRLAPVWLMLHEVAFPMARHQPLRHNFLGAVHRVMAWLVGRSARRIFVSTPAWVPLLRPLLPRRRVIEWLAVPSNIPTLASPQAVAKVRSWAAPDNAFLLGHFGTYGEHVTDLLKELIPAALAQQAHIRFLLMGRGGKRFVDELRTRCATGADRLLATGGMPPLDLADHLAACDLLLQPYPEGITARRGSVMACLGLGMPVLTNSGFLTETLWSQLQVVALAPNASSEAYMPLLSQLIASESARAQVAAAGANAYKLRFALERTVAVLQGSEQAPEAFLL